MRKWIRGIFAGGLLGFIAGMLFAPEKGEETRKKVQDAIDKGKEKFKEIKENWEKKGE